MPAASFQSSAFWVMIGMTISVPGGVSRESNQIWNPEIVPQEMMGVGYVEH